MVFPERFENFKELFNPSLFAEGYRGLIYTFTLNGEKYAVKTPQEEKLIPTFQKEARILEYLKSCGVSFVPQLVFAGEDYFIYRFIEGEPFKKIQKQLTPEKFRYFLRKLLVAAYLLDKLGVFKNEFQRPFTNVLIKDKNLYLIDFERGQLNKYWKNVPQYLQYLIAVGVLNKEEAIHLGKFYKQHPEQVVKETLKKLYSTS